LKTASRSFHEFFGDCLQRIGFFPSRADQDLWIRKSDDYHGYDYIATHVDNIIIAAKRPQEYMAMIEQEFMV
jgi:restriction endonuclease Mrr